ncbi:hypothetical protein C8R47DRAFT_1072449 [Mycena vitilis]|nr:hypothetical protein C8R47DRAFT_1072449 [Mycena vitilis]
MSTFSGLKGCCAVSVQGPGVFNFESILTGQIRPDSLTLRTSDELGLEGPIYAHVELVWDPTAVPYAQFFLTPPYSLFSQILQAMKLSCWRKPPGLAAIPRVSPGCVIEMLLAQPARSPSSPVQSYMMITPHRDESVKPATLHGRIRPEDMSAKMYEGLVEGSARAFDQLKGPVTLYKAMRGALVGIAPEAEKDWSVVGLDWCCDLRVVEVEVDHIDVLYRDELVNDLERIVI